jgi:photosystem II stability/assembly factor-like uncharacterized protein
VSHAGAAKVVDAAAEADDEAPVVGGGYDAQVVKTTDGGQTWTSVFENLNNADYYFNQISCWNTEVQGGRNKYDRAMS